MNGHGKSPGKYGLLIMLCMAGPMSCGGPEEQIVEMGIGTTRTVLDGSVVLWLGSIERCAMIEITCKGATQAREACFDKPCEPACAMPDGRLGVTVQLLKVGEDWMHLQSARLLVKRVKS